MKVKICGMVHSENIKAISELSPDYLGFIFYEKSKRYASGKLDKEQLGNLPGKIKKIGVFVNPSIEEIIEKVSEYQLDLVQLHGDETPDFCALAAGKGLKIIKAFSTGANFDFKLLNNYKPFCDFFLFDTPGKDYGGNGISFDWNILNNYDNSKPFFLSGGIDLENIKEINKLKHLNIHSVDVNSKFEISPGLKDIVKIKKLMDFMTNLKRNIITEEKQ
jgi:phosphoribosylanthranilate isomerase